MKAYYQEIAPDYARLRRVHPEVFRHLIESGPIHAGSRVLEIGCGTGNYICALLKTEMLEAGFGHLAQTQVEFSAVLEDLEPYRARVFSSLRLISQEAFARGMARPESDFQKGPIPWVSRYLMLWGTRPAE
jgi:hypothetical protein